MVIYLASSKLSKVDLAEIADLVTEIVNPGKQFKARIRYAGSGRVFLYSDSTIKKKNELRGSQNTY